MSESKPETPTPNQSNAPVINLDVSGQQNQINAGVNNNVSQTINNYDQDLNDSLIDQLMASLKQTAAVNDVDLDIEAVDQLGADMQSVYDNTEATEEEAKGVVDRFREFVSSYSERFLPMLAKSSLGLLSTAAAATGHPLVAMLLTVMQDAVEQ